MKKSLLYTAAGVLACGALFACVDRAVLWADPNVLTVTVVATHPLADVTSLTAAIASAQSLYDSAVEGTLPGQYPAPLKVNLQAAITAASAVNGTYSQVDVDAATATLQAAINTFKAGMIDLTPLHAAIVAAQDDISHAIVGAAAGNYAQASVDTLSAAVTVAQGIVSAVAQSVILAATATLNAATSLFEGSVILASNQTFLEPSTTLTPSVPQAVVTSGDTSTSTISVPATVSNPTLDMTVLAVVSATTTSATVPGDFVAHVVTSLGTVDLLMPANTTLTAPDSLWSGVLNLPQATSLSSVTTPDVSGQATAAVATFEIGADGVPLTFNHAVRVALLGKTGYYAGYTRDHVVTPIATRCADDTQATNDLLPADGDCVMDAGSDMVIWTKHFTTFVAYGIPASAPSGGGASGGGGSGIFSGGGGGGGGGGLAASLPGVPLPYSAGAGSVVVRGTAYVGSAVSLSADGQTLAKTTATADGTFEFTLANVTPGVYTYGVQATDSRGTRSTMRTVTVIVTPAAGTIISGVVVPPTITADKTQVQRGSIITFFGQSAPGSALSLLIQSLLQPTLAKPVSANPSSGEWQLLFATDKAAAFGAYTASIVSLFGTSTPLSSLLSFTIGNEDVSKTGLPAAILALSPDGVINLNDFSILAYWYKRPLTTPAAQKADLNHDGVVDLRDFSILAYYWTGN